MQCNTSLFWARKMGLPEDSDRLHDVMWYGTLDGELPKTVPKTPEAMAEGQSTLLRTPRESEVHGLHPSRANLGGEMWHRRYLDSQGRKWVGHDLYPTAMPLQGHGGDYYDSPTP